MFARSERAQIDCHDVFCGEQSDASCFVRHGGLRWWCSSPACWRGVLRAALPAVWAFGVQSWLACCSILLGSKMGGSIEPPFVGRFALSSII